MSCAVEFSINSKIDTLVQMKTNISFLHLESNLSKAYMVIIEVRMERPKTNVWTTSKLLVRCKTFSQCPSSQPGQRIHVVRVQGASDYTPRPQVHLLGKL